MSTRVQAAGHEVPISGSPLHSGMLQRRCTCDKHTNGGEYEACRDSRLGWQRQHADQSEPTGVPPIVHDVLRSPGQPLEGETKAVMEPHFGRDFSRVRVHTSPEAAASAASVDASAYTVGRDVVFGWGQYSPQTFVGRNLLAHELAHVAQQAAGGGFGTADTLEAEAEHAAAEVSAGKPAQVATGAPLGMQRQPLSVQAGATVPRLEAQQVLENWLALVHQGQHQGDRVRRSLRVTPEIRASVLQMFRNDPIIGHQISIQAWLQGHSFPSEAAEFARQVARYLPERLPVANLAHLRRSPTDERSALGRVRDLVEGSRAGEPGPDSPAARANPPAEPTSNERAEQLMQDQASRVRRERGLPDPIQVGPASVDVLRLGRIVSGLPGTLSPPRRASPSSPARSYPEVEAAVNSLAPDSLTPPSLRGTPQADGFPDAQAVAREVARRLDLAQQAGQDAVFLELGVYSSGQPDILRGLREVLRVVVTALPHHASSVRTVIVSLGPERRWLPVPRTEAPSP